MTLRDRILAILMSATTPITADRIADIVYADDPDGGPISAHNNVRVSINFLRRAGHAIETARGRSGGYTYHGSVVGTPDGRTRFEYHRDLRRVNVDRLYRRGDPIPAIARALGVHPGTVFADLRHLRAVRAAERTAA